MTRLRFTPRPTYEAPTIPFLDAEEAWFWFVRCQRARAEGVRFEGVAGSAARPCDPDDLYRAVVDLHRRRRITAEHLRVLALFGLSERPPDSRCREEERSARLWTEALDRLETVLKEKGIVE
ncbi:MAG: hypothetical protein ACE5GT_10165 [Rhodospirillales bacterium]